jgi:hypothetical protein
LCKGIPEGETCGVTLCDAEGIKKGSPEGMAENSMEMVHPMALGWDVHK